MSVAVSSDLIGFGHNWSILVRTGLCPNHGLLCLLWWSDAQHSPWYRHFWLVVNSYSTAAIFPWPFPDTACQHCRPPRPPRCNVDCCTSQRLLPDETLGDFTSPTISRDYGYQPFRGNPVLKWTAKYVTLPWNQLDSFYELVSLSIYVLRWKLYFDTSAPSFHCFFYIIRWQLSRMKL